MTILEIVILLVVAAICGGLGQAIAGYSRGGCFAAMALGFVGAMLGTWIARELELPELFVLHIDDVAFPIVWSIIGSALFAALVSLAARPAKRPR